MKCTDIFIYLEIKRTGQKWLMFPIRSLEKFYTEYCSDFLWKTNSCISKTSGTVVLNKIPVNIPYQTLLTTKIYS